MEPVCEKLDMPDRLFRIKSFVSESLEHIIEAHPHWHPEIEILYIICGCAKQQVNEQIFTVEGGDVVIIGKDQLHSTYSYLGSECRILVIQFDADTLLPYSLSCNDKSIPGCFSASLKFSNPIKSNSGKGKNLAECICEIHNELEKRQKAYGYMVKSLLCKLTGIILRNGYYEENYDNYVKTQEARQMLENTFKLIDEFYIDKISLKEAASASNLSITHFCRLFKRTTGMTFNDYLTFYRINHAEKMLGTSLTITEIALECGFGSLSTFIRSFKKFKNCTPSKYRK